MRTSLVLSLAIVLLAGFAAGQTVYKQVGTYPLPGDGGWDYLIYDTAADRIFIARGSMVLVVDPEGKKLGEVPSNGAHGVALVQDKGVGYSANGRAGTVTLFDLKTLKPLQDIKVGEGPDSLNYDHFSHRVLVMDGRSNDITVIDPESNKVINTVPLGGSPEEAATAPGKVWVNVADKNEIVEIDSAGWKVTNRWKLPDCEEPTGLAINEKHDTLFTACGNSKMLVLNAADGKVLATVPTGAGTDGAGYDNGYAFASNGSGTLTVVEKSGDTWRAAENVPTQKSARTMTIDPKTHRVFTVAAEFGPPPAGQRRGPMVSGTFRLLVFAPVKP